VAILLLGCAATKHLFLFPLYDIYCKFQRLFTAFFYGKVKKELHFTASLRLIIVSVDIFGKRIGGLVDE